MLTSELSSYTFMVRFLACMQVARQPAMECLPLVMEPESRFYSDPVAVLDFQSLYPSMVRAPLLAELARDQPISYLNTWHDPAGQHGPSLSC